MPATAEPTASFPDMRPRTVHDAQSKTLDVYISVSMGPNDTVVVAAPALAVLSGDWTLRWILVLEDGLKAEFADPPLEIDVKQPPPPLVTFPVKDIENFGSYCTGSLSNNVIGANHFKYLINIAYTPPNSWKPIVIHHDPTIALTPDPITKSHPKPIG